MADSIDFVQRFQYSMIRMNQCFQDQIHTDTMIHNRLLGDYFVFTFRFIGKTTVSQTDFFYNTFGEHDRYCIHIQ